MVLLYACCYCYSVDMTRLLVRLGASLSLVDIDNNTGMCVRKYFKCRFKQLSRVILHIIKAVVYQLAHS